MENIGTSRKTREILDKYKLRAKKKFGQNFLINNSILDDIVYAADVDSEDTIIEIGPGIGSLTEKLANVAKKVIAIEIDKDMVSVLDESLCEYDNIEIINNDILKTDLKSLIQGDSVKVIGNLPYYITTPVIMNILEQKLNIESLTIMIQKEVAMRIESGPGTKDYGALSLACQYYSSPKIICNVSPDNFIPRPNVDSSVIRLDILKEPMYKPIDEKLLFRVIRAGFSQRRKTLVNALNNGLNVDIDKSEIGDLLVDLGHDIRIRGEALNLKQFVELADKIYNYIHS